MVGTHEFLKVIKSRLSGPEFVWLLPGWYGSNWWNVTNADCTAEEMKSGLEHTLTNSANPLIGANLSRVVESGKVKVIFYMNIAMLLIFVIKFRTFHSFKVI